MARRKKEPEGFHRAQIAAAAGKLFAAQGVAQTTMDQVAQTAGYSKATVYVYFQNKEELVGALTLESMKLLHGHLCAATAAHSGAKERYFAICAELVRYQAAHPFYFQAALGNIEIDLERADCLPVERETFAVGEQILSEIGAVLSDGVASGVFRPELCIAQTVFQLWAGLSGLVLLAANKRAYVQTVLHTSTDSFLQTGFELLYRTIAKEV